MGTSDYEIAFLRKVLDEEIGNLLSDHKLLIIAVHAVLLESGFVPFDSSTKKKMDGFQNLCEGWALEAKYFDQNYIIDLSCPDGIGGYDAVDIIDADFVACKEDLKVLVTRTPKQSGEHSQFFMLCLEKSSFVPSIKFLCLNTDEVKEKEGSSSSSSSSSFKSYHESRVSEFWKITKDNLVLPLLIQLCEDRGLPLPPCFMGLHPDLKLKILGFLSGSEIARLACVSSEMRYLCSNNDLLRQKVKEGFEKLPTVVKMWYALGRTEEINERTVRTLLTYIGYSSIRRRIVKGD